MPKPPDAAPDLSPSGVQHSLDGAADAALQQGLGPRPRLPEPETPETFGVLYCDGGLFVVDKPAGLPVHPTGRYLNGTVVGRMRQRLGHGFAAPVHRLDRETSGVLMCARTQRMARALTRLWMAGGIDKEYLAICLGAPRAPHFVVDAPLAPGAGPVRIGMHVAADGTGKAARTAFTLLQHVRHAGVDYSIWRVVPQSGRRHQIRVHLQHAGYPLVGDKIYGTAPEVYLRFCDRTLTPADWRTLRLGRHALHASCLRLRHPFSGAPMVFTAPLPADLAHFVAHGPT